MSITELIANYRRNKEEELRDVKERETGREAQEQKEFEEASNAQIRVFENVMKKSGCGALLEKINKEVLSGKGEITPGILVTGDRKKPFARLELEWLKYEEGLPPNLNLRCSLIIQLEGRGLRIIGGPYRGSSFLEPKDWCKREILEDALAKAVVHPQVSSID